jgi:hypothetical protein
VPRRSAPKAKPTPEQERFADLLAAGNAALVALLDLLSEALDHTAKHLREKA